MSSGHLPRYHVQEAAEAHTVSTARKLDAGILEKYTQDIGTPRVGGLSSYSYHILEVPEALGSLSTTAEPLIISHCTFLLPGECGECAPAQRLASVSIARPRAVNYKSGFSTVSSSQPGSGPSFSFVNEAKAGLFPGFVSCDVATLSLPSSPHLSEPPFVPFT